MTKLLILVMAVVGAVALGTPLYLSGAQSEDAQRWIRRHAMPLASVEAGHGFDDMKALSSIIGAAQVIAMGEATHGTRDFFQFKHRILEFLASQKKFDVVVLAMEADWPASLDINDYVLQGKGNPEDLLKKLNYWVWQTQEILDMVRWIRAHNVDPSNSTKIKVYGIDGPAREQTADQIEAYLKKVDPQYASGLPPFTKAQLIAVTSWNAYSKLTFEERKVVSDAISDLEERFHDYREDYVDRSDEREWMLIRHHVTVFRQTEEYFSTYEPGSINEVRDRHMAENVRWIREYEGPSSQVMVWAHNGHVSKSTGNSGQPAMGSYLRQSFGSQLVVVGFAFGGGSFRAYDLETKRRVNFTVGPALEGSFDAVLSSVGIPVYALDLRELPRISRASSWLASPRSMRLVGAVFSCNGEDRLMGRFKHQAVVDNHYDVLVFINQTSAARPLTDSSPTNERDCTTEMESAAVDR